MQKVINVLAVASFVVSAGVVGVGAYVYANQDAIKAQIEKEVADAVKDAVGGALGGALTDGPAAPEGVDESSPIPMPAAPF